MPEQNLNGSTLQHLNRQDVQLGEIKTELRVINAKVSETNGRVTKTEHKVISDANMLAVLDKGFKDIEQLETERVKEAHEDRKALKTAIYSFVIAISASALGALILVLAGSIG